MSEHMPPTRYVQSPVILQMLDISRPTLEKLIEHEGFPVINMANRLRRFDLAAVNAWIDAHRNDVDSRWSTRIPDEESAA